MIGNDIIDLSIAQKESDWKRKGFLDKIFTTHEQKLILKAKNQEQTVWDFWSRKEAAYKIFNRDSGIRIYNPLQFQCYDLETSKEINFGKVMHNNITYFTKTEITEAYIHTIAVTDFEHFEAIKFLKNRENIQKNRGIPNWIDPKTFELKPVSISHHGQFIKIVTL